VICARSYTRPSAAALVMMLGVSMAGTLLSQVQPQGQRLYVTNQDDATVSVIDVGTRKLVETVDLQKIGFGPNAKPHHTPQEADGMLDTVAGDTPEDLISEALKAAR